MSPKDGSSHSALGLAVDTSLAQRRCSTSVSAPSSLPAQEMAHLLPGVGLQETLIQLSSTLGPTSGETDRPSIKGRWRGRCSAHQALASAGFSSLPVPFRPLIVLLHTFMLHEDIPLCISAAPAFALSPTHGEPLRGLLGLFGRMLDPLSILEELSASLFPKLHLLVPQLLWSNRKGPQRPSSESRYLKSTYCVQGTSEGHQRRLYARSCFPKVTAEATCHPRARTRHGATASPALGTLIQCGSLSVECTKDL